MIDLRNLGLIGAIELEPIPGKPGARGYDIFVRAFEKGLLVRVTGDIIALSPPLIIERKHIDEVFGTLAEVLQRHTVKKLGHRTKTPGLLAEDRASGSRDFAPYARRNLIIRCSTGTWSQPRRSRDAFAAADVVPACRRASSRSLPSTYFRPR